MATQAAGAIAWARSKIGSYAYSGMCQAFVADALYYGGKMRPRRSAKSATAAGDCWIIDRSRTNIPAGACVYFTSPTDPKNGHVGLYIGNNQVIHAFGAVRLMTMDAILSAGYGYRGWGWNGGVKPTGADCGVMAGAASGGLPSTNASEQAAAVVHIPQTEKVYTVYEDDTPDKPPDQYRVTWQSGGTVREITDRVGELSLTDDVDSLCLELTFQVLQATGEKFLQPLVLACGDFVSVVNTGSGECVFLGQVQTVSGSYRDTMAVTCLDAGRLLTTNEVLIQFNNVAAKTALAQLARTVGIQAISCPNLVSSVYSIEKSSAADIAKTILATVTAENGVPYFLRMMGNTLVIRSFAKTCIRGWHRQEANLAAFDILGETSNPQVSWDIGDLRNQVMVYSEDDHAVQVLATTEDPNSVRRYGRRTALETFSDQDAISASAKAKQTLAAKNKVQETFSVVTYGSDKIVAGVRLKVDLQEIQGEFWVTSVTHDLGTPHRMSMTLRRAEGWLGNTSLQSS